jgi:hypothetical protein
MGRTKLNRTTQAIAAITEKPQRGVTKEHVLANDIRVYQLIAQRYTPMKIKVLIVPSRLS